jgi:hypothetical protein
MEKRVQEHGEEMLVPHQELPATAAGQPIEGEIENKRCVKFSINWNVDFNVASSC